MGYYMGVFNFFIVIPQIVAATILGFFTMKLFGANTLNTLVLGGASMIVAGVMTLWVKDDDNVASATQTKDEVMDMKQRPL
jgi:maltose/moltooligosaccharide transporter